MMRFVLVTTLLIGSLGLTGSPAADHLGPAATKDQARAEIYERIMTMVLLDKMTYILGVKADEGKSPAYRSYEINKALAVCINWQYSSHMTITHGGFWLTHGYHMKGKSKRSALQNCKGGWEEKYGCTCQIVDQNDENVLEVPEPFLTRYMGSQSTVETMSESGHKRTFPMPPPNVRF